MIGIVPATMVLAAVLSTATTQAQTPMVSMYHAAGTIVDISENEDAGRFCVNVRLDGFGMPYDGHIYAIDLTPGDLSDWISEQGPISNDDRVFCWMESNGTPIVLDDEVYHIGK